MKLKPSKYKYVVIDTVDGSSYIITDSGGVSDLIGRSGDVIKGWFRGGVIIHETDDWIIAKYPKEIKSKRGFQ